MTKQKFLLKKQKLNSKMAKLRKPRKYLRKFVQDAQKKPCIVSLSIILLHFTLRACGCIYQNILPTFLIWQPFGIQKALFKWML